MATIEEHNFTLKGIQHRLYIPTALAENEDLPPKIFYGAIETIDNKYRERYYIVSYKITSTLEIQVNVQKDLENLTIPKMMESGAPVSIPKVSKETARLFFNSPTGSNSRGESDAKALSRVLCEIALGGWWHDIIPFTEDVNLTGIQPIVFEVSQTTSDGSTTITVNVTDGVSPYQYSLDNISYQSSNVFIVASNTGERYIYVKDSTDNVQKALITIQ